MSTGKKLSKNVNFSTNLEAPRTKSKTSKKRDLEPNNKPKKKSKTSNVDETKKIKEENQKRKLKEDVKKTPIKTVPITQPKIEETTEYSDDFEDYSDDFEDDDDNASPEEEPVKNVVVQKTEKLPTPKYESDFEDDSSAESEVEDVPLQAAVIQDPTPLLQRLNEKREQQYSPPTKVSIKDEESQVNQSTYQTSLNGTSPGRTINFASATVNPAEAILHNEKRFTKLRELIKFEYQQDNLLNLTSNKEYDFYLELFGASGKKQMAVQTNDDDMEAMTQTDQVETEDKWSQHPMLIEKLHGAESNNEENDISIFRSSHLDNQQLKQFISTASQIVLELVSSHSPSSKHSDLQNRSNLPFSKGYHALILPSTFKGRVTSICRIEKLNEFIFVAVFIKESLIENIIAKTLIIQYSVDNTEPPKRIYFAEGEATSISLSSDGTFLCAGMKDGSVLLYDLLETNNEALDSLPWPDAPNPITLQRPDFDTSFYSTEINGTGTSSPIVDVQFIISAEKKQNTQVAVLDQSARLWVYSCHRNAEFLIKGMTPGTNVYMTLSALIRPDTVVQRNSSIPTSVLANCLAIPKTSQFILGTDVGFLTTISKSKINSNNVPRLYRDKTQFFGEVMSIQPSIHRPDLLLAGLSTGCISVFSLQRSSPLTILTPSSSLRKSVKSIEWSPTDPDLFYSIHGGTKLLIWSLKSKSPLVTSTVDEGNNEVCCMKTWFDTSSKNISYLALGYNTGNVEVHLLETIKST